MGSYTLLNIQFNLFSLGHTFTIGKSRYKRVANNQNRLKRGKTWQNFVKIGQAWTKLDKLGQTQTCTFLQLMLVTPTFSLCWIIMEEKALKSGGKSSFMISRGKEGRRGGVEVAGEVWPPLINCDHWLSTCPPANHCNAIIVAKIVVTFTTGKGAKQIKKSSLSTCPPSHHQPLKYCHHCQNYRNDNNDNNDNDNPQKKYKRVKTFQCLANQCFAMQCEALELDQAGQTH